MDPYDILGVPKDASDSAIKQAFRKRSKETHPDIKGAGSAAAFEEVVRANLVLSDPKARERYDRTGECPDTGTTQHPDHAAHAIIGQMLSTLIEEIGDDLFRKDVVKVMIQHLNQGISQTKGNIQKLERKAARAEKMRGRFTTTTGQQNILEGVVNAKIADYRRAIQMNTDALVAPQRAAELLKAYRYKTDPADPSHGDLAKMMQQQLDMAAKNSFFGGFFSDSGAT